MLVLLPETFGPMIKLNMELMHNLSWGYSMLVLLPETAIFALLSEVNCSFEKE